MKDEQQSIKRHDQAEMLFDPGYFKKMLSFTDRGFISEDEEARFDNEGQLIGNEKFIRGFTMDKIFVYKEGGLVIVDDCCFYKPDYINPYDLLYIMDEGYVRTVCFSELVVYAMNLVSPDDDDEKIYTIVFRSVKTGNFFVITYLYSEYYLVDIRYEREEYFRYYACEYNDSIEKEIHDLAIKEELTLYNTNQYQTLRRGNKIDFILDLLK